MPKPPHDRLAILPHQRRALIRAQCPGLAALHLYAACYGYIELADDLGVLRRVARTHGVSHNGWRILSAHALRMSYGLAGTAQYRINPVVALFHYATLLARAGIDGPLPAEIVRLIAHVLWHLDPATDGFCAVPTNLLRAVVDEVEARGLANNSSDHHAGISIQLAAFAEHELTGVMHWLIGSREQAARRHGNRALPWRWWCKQALTHAQKRPIDGTADADNELTVFASEWPILVAPFERDGIRIEEIWSIAGLRREALRMRNCLDEAEYTIDSMRGTFRAYRLASANDDDPYATVGLRRIEDTFVVDEVRGFANQQANGLAWRIARELAFVATATLDP